MLFSYSHTQSMHSSIFVSVDVLVVGILVTLWHSCKKRTDLFFGVEGDLKYSGPNEAVSHNLSFALK